MTIVDPALLGQIRYRCIGPTRGGRVVAVAASPTEQAVFYFGGAAGGVWKTDDAGLYWQNVTDGFLTSASIGALAVAGLAGGLGQRHTALLIERAYPALSGAYRRRRNPPN